MVSRPLISVVIPAHNAASHIGETLDSVLRQTYPRREIIVVDDGSTDNTLERLSPYKSSISYIWQENAGPGAARNAGLRAASGDYIAFLDADDLWHPEKLEIQLQVTKRHPESGLIACNGIRFDATGGQNSCLIGGRIEKTLYGAPTGEVTGYFYRDFVRENLITAPAQTLIPRWAVDDVGLMLHDVHTCEDWDYYLRIALTHPMTFHNDSLVRYRYLPTSLSGPHELRQFRWTMDLIPVLKRHLSLCRLEDRPHVARGIRARIRSQAWAAYYYGRRHDLAYARRYLIRLFSLVPSEWSVLSLLIGLSFPDSVVSRMGQLSRRIMGGGHHEPPGISTARLKQSAG